MKETDPPKLASAHKQKVAELDTEKLRKRLLTIETDIKTIIGPRKEKDWVDVSVGIDRENLGDLLRSIR